MTTYLSQLKNALAEKIIPAFWLGYFRENFRSEVNDQLVELFHATGLSKADLARKLGRRPEQVTRWLAAPSNLGLDTVSDLALALGCVPKLNLEKVGCDKPSQKRHPFSASLDTAGSTSNVSTSEVTTPMASGTAVLRTFEFEEA